MLAGNGLTGRTAPPFTFSLSHDKLTGAANAANGYRSFPAPAGNKEDHMYSKSKFQEEESSSSHRKRILRRAKDRLFVA